ncbi:MAG: hypothetical protein ACREFO_10855, partial [Acetobacteraceae bacterium]
IWVMLMFGGSGNNRGAIPGAFVIWAIWDGTTFVISLISPALQAISHDLTSRSAFLRGTLIAILLGLVVLFRLEGLIRERKIVSDFLPKRKPPGHPG